ncbi:helix-turn-helix domain-containing protein [Paenacidovorax monticola]|uniref:helix-turn-helix domain-containing protein n=1 Tax=Paenacidovorax monticola TaxID=1926868 RepID=UPI001FE32F8A|nr:helix-turn-helix transcriptional regulator [Paenacidovorax monticola]
MTTKKEKLNPEMESLTRGIGSRLKEERKRLHLKATDFESHGGWPASTIYGWEAGKASPKSEFYAATAKLGFDVQYIITGRRTSGSLTGRLRPCRRFRHRPHPSAKRYRQHGKGNDLITEDVLMGR